MSTYEKTRHIEDKHWFDFVLVGNKPKYNRNVIGIPFDINEIYKPAVICLNKPVCGYENRFQEYTYWNTDLFTCTPVSIGESQAVKLLSVNDKAR